MNNKMIGAAAFLIGAASGFFTAWYIAENKYKKIAQEEIDSVKSVYSKKRNDDKTEKENEDKTEHETILRSEHYIYEEKEEDDDMEKPYVISPEEFGDYEDYERISLTYYTDEVLTDENDEIVDNIDEVVGSDSLNHFGEYEDDSVFVRNDRLKCDYEILLDHRKYRDLYR